MKCPRFVREHAGHKKSMLALRGSTRRRWTRKSLSLLLHQALDHLANPLPHHPLDRIGSERFSSCFRLAIAPDGVILRAPACLSGRELWVTTRRMMTPFRFSTNQPTLPIIRRREVWCIHQSCSDPLYSRSHHRNRCRKCMASAICRSEGHLAGLHGTAPNTRYS